MNEYTHKDESRSPRSIMYWLFSVRFFDLGITSPQTQSIAGENTAVLYTGTGFAGRRSDGDAAKL